MKNLQQSYLVGFLNTFFIIVFFILSFISSSQAQPQPTSTINTVPASPSIVFVSSRKLMVRNRRPNGSLSAARAYVIHGVTWNPSTKAPALGPDPSYGGLTQYGFFFDWPGRAPQGHELFAIWQQTEFEAHYQQDLPLIQGMNANTVRVYSDMNSDPGVTKRILDECYRRGIMVIMTVANTKMDLDSKRYLYVVNVYKNHPAILMWALGNEWNSNLYFAYSNINSAMMATNLAAQEIKAQDRNHPVSSVLGDQFNTLPVICKTTDTCCTASDGTNNVPVIVKEVSAVDIWGLNIYRGKTFGNLFAQWRNITTKPFYLSEFGIDSFASNDFKVINCYQAGNVIGQEDQLTQATGDIGLWQELKKQLSTVNKNGQAVGGLIHEFNDELWKVGSFIVGLGGLVDYDGPDNIASTADDDTSYDDYNSEGFYGLGAQPDNVFNEEYFGVVDANRVPKPIYWQLKNFYAQL